VSLVTLIATTLLFAANMHTRMLLALVDSYRILPPGVSLQLQPALGQLTRRLGDTLLLSIRLASPFVVLSIIVNLSIALINKVSPVIPSFFVAQPVLLVLGLLLFLVAAPDFFDQFTQALASWIDRI
jgi:flagellar biosynthetic protein FliR